MKPELHPGVQRACDIYQKAVAAGEEPSVVVGHLAQMEGVLRPAIWRRLRRGGVLPPYGTRKSPGRRAETKPRNRPAEANYEDAVRVQRDPCPRCGARGDYDCGHSHVPLGMVL